MPSRHRLILQAALALVLAAIVGCSSFKPEGDYEKAGTLIRDRAQVSDVYDPSLESEIEGRVSQLLEGGLTQDEALSVAMLNNPAFQAKFLDIGVSRAEVVQSGLLQNPVMFVSGRIPEGAGRVNLSFSIAQELVDLWRIPVRKKIAGEQLKKTITEVVNEALTLRNEVRQATYTYLAAQRTQNAANEDHSLLVHLQALTQHRFEAGEATVLDVRLVEADVVDASTEQLARDQDTQDARIELARVLGLTRWEQAWELTDVLPSPSETFPDDATLMKLAADRRLDLQMAAMDVSTAEDELLEQCRSILPSLVVGIDGERPEMRAPRSRDYAPLENIELVKGPGYTPADARLDAIHTAGDVLRHQLAAKRDRDFEKQQAINLLLGPSLEVTLPLWDQNQAGIAKARIHVLQKQKELEASLDQAAADVLQAAASVRNAAEALRLVETVSLPQAQATLETAKRVYEAGEESILALMAAQRTVIRQHQYQAATEGRYALALASLEHALGGPIDGTASPGQEDASRE